MIYIDLDKVQEELHYEFGYLRNENGGDIFS